MKLKKIKKYNNNQRYKYISQAYQWYLLIRYLKENKKLNEFKYIISNNTQNSVNSIQELVTFLQNNRQYYGMFDEGYYIFLNIREWINPINDIIFFNILNNDLLSNIRLINIMNNFTYTKQNHIWNKIKSFFNYNNI